MISRAEVNNLATLARLELPATEVEKLRQDLESILGYVSRLKAEASDLFKTPQAKMLSDNTLRPDGPAHKSGIYTERLLAASPENRDGYLVVKPIFIDYGH